jgi:hypothetical protein
MMSELDYTEKICCRCNEKKHLTEFSNHCKSSDGKSSVCAECNRAASNKWYYENKETARATARRSSLKSKYGITLEQYDELLQKQNNCCAVCERHEKTFKSKLAVDHNHKTGEIRGLLCTNCNHRLIGRHTDAERLHKMAEYISQGTGWFVPEKKPKKRKKKLDK